MVDRRVGIDGLARELGLAKSTVSRALNDYPDIAAETKERVREAALRAGYHASALARRLKRGRVETVGIVLAEPGHHLESPHLSAFLAGVARGLEGNGLDLLVATAPAPDRWQEVYERLVEGRKADGFVVIRTETDDPRVRHLLGRGIPFVAHGRTAGGPSFAWVDVDNAAAAAEAVEHLARLGHRRIAHLAGPARYNFARLRREGFARGLAAAGLAADPALVVECAISSAAGEAGARTVLARAEPPTAIVAATDALALGAIRAIRAAGLTVGRDVSVVGYDDVPMAAVVDPPLTTFDQASAEAGECAARLLVRLLAGEPASALRVLRRARLVRRASDGPPAATPQDLRRRIDAAASHSRQGRD